MTTLKKIKKSDLSKWIDKLISQGKQVLAPKLKNKKVLFSEVRSYTEIEHDYIQTSLSAKDSVFPRCEELFSYTTSSEGMQVNNTVMEVKNTVVFGLRPCDASAFNYLDSFFKDPNPDYHYYARRDKNTLIAVSCTKADDFCFCTSVGINPGTTNGADVLLTYMDNDDVYAEVLTDKGQSVVSISSELFFDTPERDKKPFLADVPVKITTDNITTKLKDLFDSDKWKTLSLGCLGCGACAYSCPTCTCFDVQDEGNIKGGVRVRCWDSCGYGLFTKHASGHNPRHNQVERRKQRLMHKFAYSVENLGTLSCVGCGRCIRVCPSQINIIENINSLIRVCP